MEDKERITACWIQMYLNLIPSQLYKHIFNWYPSSQQYHDVFTSLLTKYPFLRESGLGSGYSILLESVKAKFKKERPSELSIVQEMASKYSHVGSGRKRKAQETDETQTSSVHTRRSLVGDYSTNFEDETSLMVHKSTLEDEYSKPRPNVEKMIDAMERTLHSRIAFFDDSSKSKTPISDVIKAFPFLKIPKLLLHEVQIRFQKNIDANLARRLPLFVDGIIKATPLKKKELFIQQLDSVVDQQDNDIMKTAAAILLLPSLFKDAETIFCVNSENPTVCTPVLVTVGDRLSPTKLSVVVDGIVVTEFDGQNTKEPISLGLSCLMATYFVYGIRYPPKLRNTLKFLEQYVFLLPADKGDTTPNAVLKLFNMLSS